MKLTRAQTIRFNKLSTTAQKHVVEMISNIEADGIIRAHVSAASLLAYCTMNCASDQNEGEIACEPNIDRLNAVIDAFDFCFCGNGVALQQQVWGISDACIGWERREENYKVLSGFLGVYA